MAQEFWDRVKELARIHRLTYTDFSLGIGKSPSYISAALQKGVVPSLGVVLDISDYLNVSLDWLIIGNEERKQSPLISKIMKDEHVVDIAYRLTFCSPELRDIVHKMIEYEEERGRYKHIPSI